MCESIPINAVLQAVGKPSVMQTMSDGSRLLILPWSGRVLGLYPPNSEDNFLWTHPALLSEKSARAYLARDQWPNLGGDRTWLAPEIEFFFGDLSRGFASYCVPPTLDPGAWHADQTDEGLTLASEAVLPLRRLGGNVHVRFGKRFSSAPNPLQGTDLAILPVSYAGYMQSTTLELLGVSDRKDDLHVGLWNLLQLPSPGTLLVPTRFEASPQVVFGSVATHEMSSGSRLMRWRMSGRDGNAKIAIKATPLTGRAGYLYHSTDSSVWNLVIREFAVDPLGNYVDALWSNPEDRGYVFQACQVGPGDESFNELEYHVPAVCSEVGRNRCEDESQVWAFRGNHLELMLVARALLGIDFCDEQGC